MENETPNTVSHDQLEPISEEAEDRSGSRLVSVMEEERETVEQNTENQEAASRNLSRNSVIENKESADELMHASRLASPSPREMENKQPDSSVATELNDRDHQGSGKGDSQVSSNGQGTGSRLM